MARADYPALYRPGRQRDDFGTLWDVHTEGLCGIPVEWPFDDWNTYGSYRWPEFAAGPPSGRLYSGHMTGKNEAWYARGGWITFFEQMQQLRGMENPLMDLAEGSPELYRLRDDLSRSTFVGSTSGVRFRTTGSISLTTGEIRLGFLSHPSSGGVTSGPPTAQYSTRSFPPAWTCTSTQTGT